jgi:hypothetical protein
MWKMEINIKRDLPLIPVSRLHFVEFLGHVAIASKHDEQLIWESFYEVRKAVVSGIGGVFCCFRTGMASGP